MTTKKIELPSQIELDQFISIQAHDLRTPFNHIIGFTKMTLNTVGDAPLTSFQKDDLGTVYRSGLRALSLMNGLIDIARINRGEKELNSIDVDIHQVVDQSLAQWKKFNPGSEIQIETNILASSPTFHVDEQLMRQIVTGFVTYVSQYCDSKAKIQLTIEEKPRQFIFTFESTGTKTRLPSELDLDMLGYVNRKLVELHSGVISKSVETDEGALIVFSIPKPK